MIERLKELSNKYTEIEKQLQDPEVMSDVAKLTSLSKQQSKLEPPYELYNKYIALKDNLEGAKELLNDPELGEVAKEECAELESELEELEKEIEIILIPKDENDDRDVIIEIRGAAGGDEANIFAGDLYRMYVRYAENKNWNTEILNSEEGTSGGFTLIQFLVKGTDVYAKLKFESGAHRVQRVPDTETQGRIHTSTATVLVMPEAEEDEVEISANDIKTDVYRSGGAGGQSVNTTDSAVRLTHLPTGIVVTCQNERSQIKNRARALQMLKTRIYQHMEEEKLEKEGAARRSKIGTGDRSEKIRTYNYPQNRVTDHRIGLTIKQLDRIVMGDLDEIINSLISEEQKERLKSGE